jgi:hypothetical protein
MQERTAKAQAVVDFDFDEAGNITKNQAQPPKAEVQGRTLDEIRQRVLAMGARRQQRSRLLSRI